MKKIINNKVYDTDTAKKLGSWENMYDSRDFGYFSEALYQKRTGEFFIYGEGGPMSKYAKTVGTNQWSGGERIMPVTMAEAQEWAENHLSADEYESIFGAIVEDDTRSALNITLPNSLIERLRREAAADGINLSAHIERRLS